MRRLVWSLGIVALLGGGYLAYERYLIAGVEVTSDPTGAEVRVDGRLVGMTPYRSDAMVPGVHRLELRHSHYAVYTRRLGVEAGGRTRLHATLDRGVGKLVLYSNPRGAWVEVDGERQPGRTPIEVTLPSGEHEIAMGMEERRSAESRVLVEADAQRELRLELDIDPHGTLAIDTVPAGARVSLPGAEADYRPGLRLPIGEYRVQARHPGYRTADVRLPVRYGDNRHRLVLERAFAALRVVTDPTEAAVTVTYADDRGGPPRRHPYSRDMRLPVGPVEVRAAAMGRRTAYRELTLSEAGASLRLTLEPVEVTVGRRFRDPLAGGDRGPELVVVPPGTFTMGSSSAPSERPAHPVALTQPFAATVHEITVADFRAFAGETGRKLAPELDGADPRRPVTHVTVDDARAYGDWLTAATGRRYRLPSEAEWEYLARAGSAGEYSFGNDPNELCRHGNVADRSLLRHFPAYGAVECDDGFADPAPVGSFPANGFGLHDMHGNVAEWVDECALPSYERATGDGAPIDPQPGCPTYGVRGGSWDGSAADARSAKRNLAASASGSRGFRLIREL